MRYYSSLVQLPLLLFIPLEILSSITVFSFAQAINHDFIDQRHILSSESSVMITGAASQLGHALSLALADTYPNIQLILFDQLEAQNLIHRDQEDELDIFPLEEQFQYPPFKDQARFEALYARFESKRQRISHVLSQISNNVHFFKTDYRCAMKQFQTPHRFDILEDIMNRFNLTHIVHLEDNVLNPNVSQAVPRARHDDRMGYLDSILYHLHRKKVEGTYVPNLIYRSTHEIYNPNDIIDRVGREEWNITSPSSIHGLEKLIEEGLARHYARVHDIPSIGLRFFHVYGPFGGGDLNHNDPIMDFIRLRVHDESAEERTNILDRQARDYIYVDDAVDAIMLAMQVDMKQGNRTLSTVINVGTGKASSIVDVLQLKNQGTVKLPSQVIASLERSNKLLGFQPQITFTDGINKTISWYKERREIMSDSFDAVSNECATFDPYCLNGRLIYPCASEWDAKGRCTPSVYDSVKNLSLYITSGCEVVQYTVALEKDLRQLPRMNDFTSSFSNINQCNIAFVREDSYLVQSLKEVHQKNPIERIKLQIKSLFRLISRGGTLKHGFWTLVPLNIPETDDRDLLNSLSLPILSPGSFFFSNYAVYVKSHFAFKNISSVIEEFDENSQTEQNIFMMKGTPAEYGHQSIFKELKQLSFYQIMQMALSDQLRRITQLKDIDYIVHRLASQTSNKFRRELYDEMMQWKVSDPKQCVEFVVSLQDYWSRFLISRRSFLRSDRIFTVFSKEKGPTHVVKIGHTE